LDAKIMKNRLLTAALTAGMLMIAAVAHADDRYFYVAPSATYTISDNDRANLDDAVGGRLSLGLALSHHWNIEIAGFAHEFESNAADDVKRQGLTLSVLGFLNRSSFSPYIEVMGGSVSSESNNNETDNVLAGLGLGALWDFTQKGFALRTAVRSTMEFTELSNGDDSDLTDWEVELGLLFPFGGKNVDADNDGATNANDRCPGTRFGLEVNERGCPKPADSDKDGIIDFQDQCPGTAKGRAVDSNGCEKDQDGDGIVDFDDRCANTPANTQVDNIGCALKKDDDGDGVENAIDVCPNTVKGVKVDAKGCAIPKEIITLKGVNFKTDSAVLTEKAKTILNRMAKRLQRPKAPTWIEVAGHTDNRGDDRYNLALSQRRADKVAAYLKGKGATQSFKPRGYGETRPIASNKTRAGRAENRRVELVILK